MINTNSSWFIRHGRRLGYWSSCSRHGNLLNVQSRLWNKDGMNEMSFLNNQQSYIAHLQKGDEVRCLKQCKTRNIIYNPLNSWVSNRDHGRWGRFGRL